MVRSYVSIPPSFVSVCLIFLRFCGIFKDLSDELISIWTVIAFSSTEVFNGALVTNRWAVLMIQEQMWQLSTNTNTNMYTNTNTRKNAIQNKILLFLRQGAVTHGVLALIAIHAYCTIGWLHKRKRTVGPNSVCTPINFVKKLFLWLHTWLHV